MMIDLHYKQKDIQVSWTQMQILTLKGYRIGKIYGMALINYGRLQKIKIYAMNLITALMFITVI